MASRTIADANVVSRRNRRLVSSSAASMTILLLWSSTGLARTFPIGVTIDEMARKSEIIVVAKVESIRGLPFLGRRHARAKVSEVWKGPVIKTVEYLASPTYACDVADARRGETVLLFLTKDKDEGWMINYSGRGRMPIRTANDKQCASYYNVRFPSEVPRIETDDDSDFKSSIELSTVHDLVKKALDAQK